jgi:hypothetical protein
LEAGWVSAGLDVLEKREDPFPLRGIKKQLFAVLYIT